MQKEDVMYIREYMVSPVITVTPDTLIDDALRTMHQHHIRRLPVVDKGKLVGLVTRQILREAIPEHPLPLTIWGVHYQLARMKVRDVMITDVITVTPDVTIGEASALASQHKIGTLPVVDEKSNLVGIITSSDLFRLLSQLLGFQQKRVRLHILSMGSTKGISQYQIMEILAKHQVNVLSIFSVTLPGTQQEDFIVHLDVEDAEPIVDELKKLGLKVEVRKY